MTVFISHCSIDFSVVDRFRSALEAASVPCWIAPRDIPSGDSHKIAIPRDIRDCELLLLFLSTSTAASVDVSKK